MATTFDGREESPRYDVGYPRVLTTYSHGGRIVARVYDATTGEQIARVEGDDLEVVRLRAGLAGCCYCESRADYSDLSRGALGGTSGVFRLPPLAPVGEELEREP